MFARCVNNGNFDNLQLRHGEGGQQVPFNVGGGDETYM
jgi:hypothetical protein